LDSLPSCPFALPLPGGLRARVEGLAHNRQRHYALYYVSKFRTDERAQGRPYQDLPWVTRPQYFCCYCDADEHS
jgi:hypothetical protein